MGQAITDNAGIFMDSKESWARYDTAKVTMQDAIDSQDWCA
jgi:hypothetical protein